MKDKNFLIKVSDLLKEAGKIDTIDFDKKYSEQLSSLTKEGISWTLTFRSLNQESVYATLTNVVCVLNETCDTCETPYERNVDVDSYTARFVLGEENRKLEQEHTDEEIFPIDGKNETIDIEDMVIQAIVLNEPVAKHCSDCAKKIEAMPDDDDSEYFEATGNLVFH